MIKFNEFIFVNPVVLKMLVKVCAFIFSTVIVTYLKSQVIIINITH